MAEINLESAVSGDSSLIQIGFGVEGYIIENTGRQQVVASAGGNSGFGSNAFPGGFNGIVQTFSGFIDDENAKQQVVNWTHFQSMILKSNEDTYTIAAGNNGSECGLPDTLTENAFASKKSNILKFRENGGDDQIVGVAAPNSFILTNIKHFYSEIDWSENDISNLISKMLLHVQVTFANGGQGISFNACVSPYGGQIASGTIAIDSQLFLSDEGLKRDFEVSVFDNSQKEYKVGTDILPGCDGEYSYEYASVSDYNDLYLAIHAINHNVYNSEQFFKKIDIKSTKYSDARVRFFITPDNKEAAATTLGGKQIPDGLVGEPPTYYTEVPTMKFDGSNLDPGDGSIPYFNPVDNMGAINYTNYAKATRIMWYFETGQANPGSNDLVRSVSEVKGDGAGINFGPYQTNRKGINSVLQYYCTVVDTDSTESQYLSGWIGKTITAASSRTPELVTNLKNICINNPTGVMRACTYAWNQTYYWQTAKSIYKKCGFNSGLGLAMCMYIPNQGFGIVGGHDTFVRNVSSKSTEYEKCKWVADAWSTKYTNWGNAKRMWTTLVEAKDFDLTGNYDWSKFGQSGRPW